jgi:hypothetical protein
MEAALQEGQQVTRITQAQDLVLEDMDMAWSSLLSPQEKLSITLTDAWTKYLVANLKACRGERDRQTHKQVCDNRLALDRRAKKAFEDEHTGPSKFAGKRVEHLTQDTLRWRVPTGLQWVECHKESGRDADRHARGGRGSQKTHSSKREVERPGDVAEQDGVSAKDWGPGSQVEAHPG